MTDEINIKPKPISSRMVEFPEGSIQLRSDGTLRCFFRNMDYVYKPGEDTTDGMCIVLSEEVTIAVKRMFKEMIWP